MAQCIVPKCENDAGISFDVCLDCTKARHRGVVNRKCTCPKSKKVPKLCKTGSRTWTSCERCLATIRQLS